jgi:hypothetical protein
LRLNGTLALFHQLDAAVIDLKPINIIMSKYFNIMLIGIIEIGDVTRKWLSLEVKVFI